MKLFKRIMLAAIAVCMTLGIVGLVSACGVSKAAKPVEYTVTVTCEDATALANVKVELDTDEGVPVKGGEAKALSGGKATFSAAAGTYKVVLTGVPETYEYNTGATVSETAPSITVVLTQKAPVGPQGPTIDAKYNGTWSNKDHTVVVDAAKGTITLDGTAATDIAEDETAGYTFKCGEKTWSLYFATETNALCLDDGDEDFSKLKAGTYTPPAPATLPADFPAKWVEEDGTEAILFDGATFTYMEEEGTVTAVTDNKDGTYTLTATYSDAEISFTWTKANYTLSLTVHDTTVTYYAEGHLPALQIALIYEGTWTAQNGTVIVIDTDANTITIADEEATDIAANAQEGYTFTWADETCSIYFEEDDYTTLYFVCGDADAVAFTKGIMPQGFPVTWYDETDEVALTFDGETFTYQGGEGVITQAAATFGGWTFAGTYTLDEDTDPFTFTAVWTVADGTLELTIDMGEDIGTMDFTFYAQPQGGGDVGGEVDIIEEYNGTFQDEEKTYTVVVDAANDTITINNVAVTNLKEDDLFGYDFDWDGKSWNLWGLAGSFYLGGTGDNSEYIALYLVEEESTVDVIEKFNGSWYDEKFLKGESEVADYIVDIDAAKDTIELDKSSVKDLAEDEASGGYTFTFDNAQYKIYFSGDDDTTLYITKDNGTPTALHKKGWKPQETDVTMPADFPTLWESSDHTEVLTFNGVAFTYAVDSESLEGTVTAVTDNKDGTYTLKATYNGGYEITLTYNSSAKTLQVAGSGWEYATALTVRLPNQIDAAYAGTWSNKTYKVVVDIDANTITINDVAATNIAKDATAGYTFTWDEVECSLYFMLGDSAHTTINFGYGEEDLFELKAGEYVPPQPVTLPDGMPKKWEMEYEDSMVTLILDEKGHISGDVGEGFLSTKTQKDDGNWYFEGTLNGEEDIFVWVPKENVLYITSDGNINSEGKFTLTPVEEKPIELPAGLDGTYYDGTGSETILTIKGKDVTTVSYAGTDYEIILAYTITACTDNSITLTGDEGATLSCTFDVQAGTFSILATSASLNTAVYYKTLPHATSYLEGFTTYTWSSNEEDEEHLLVFEQDTCNFTYDGKKGYIYRVDEDYALLYGFCEGAFLSFEWSEAEDILYVDPLSDYPVELYPVKEEFDPSAFLALGLDGTWYGDSYVGSYAQVPIRITFKKDSLEAKFALNGTDDTGEVTAYDDATKTITAVIGGDTYYFVYAPETGRITDGNPEGADSTKNYGPYIHYNYDFNSTAIQAPAWFGYTFAGGETTLTISGNYLVVNGASQNTIRHYDAEKKELIVLFEGAHVFVTYDDGANTLNAAPLKEGAYGTISGTFNKVPDPLDPNLTWLGENTWETAEGGSISFEGANVTVNATGINNWKGFITAHEAEKKTLTVYFIGHGSATITYTEEAVRTLTCTLGGKLLTFTQTVVLTLPEEINGKWVGKDDWKSVTIEDGKMTVESDRHAKGPYDITNVANEGNIWTFNVNVSSTEQDFTYDKENDTLTVAIYNGNVTFKRYEEPAADPSELWAALSDTEWKPVSGAEVASYQSITISADHTVTITTTTNEYPLKVDDAKHLTYDSETTTWTITVSSTVNNYFIYYNTATKVLSCGHAIYTNEPKVTTFEKVEKAPLTLPEAIYNATWTSDNTSYGYAISFTETQATIQYSSGATAYTGDIEDLQYNAETKTWTFTAYDVVSTMLTYMYKFTYVDGENTIAVAFYRSKEATSVSSNFTLTKQGGGAVDYTKLPEALLNTTWKGTNSASAVIVIKFGTDLSIMYATSDTTPSKSATVTIDAEASKDGVWVFSFEIPPLGGFGNPTVYKLTYNSNDNFLTAIKDSLTTYPYTLTKAE